jgi:hypothetical protein
MSLPGDSPEIQASTVGCLFDHVEVSFSFCIIEALLKLKYIINLLIYFFSFVMLKFLLSMCLGIAMN